MKVTYAMVKAPGLYQNELLSVLLTEISDRIAADLKLVDLPSGAIIYEAGVAERYAYFPSGALISLLPVIENGKSTEVAVVGNEGMVGIDTLTGGHNPCSQAVVQCAGAAYRVPTQLLKEEFKRHNEMRWLLLRYIQSLFVQISQAAVCNRHHSVEQQFCRKLLTSADRLSADEIALTQGKIAELLGVRREGVTAAAGELRKLGVIDYRRGHIRILNRKKLEELSCECYAVVKSECDRLRPSEFRKSTLNVVPRFAAHRPAVAVAGRRNGYGGSSAYVS